MSLNETTQANFILGHLLPRIETFCNTKIEIFIYLQAWNTFLEFYL